MKSMSKVFVGVAVAAVLAIAAAPVAQAQCSPAQFFQSIGQAMATCTGGSCKQVIVNTAGTDNAGNEIGRFWSAANSANANNFAGTCPSTNNAVTLDSWWDLSGANRGIGGQITGGTCIASTCPSPANDQMIFLVEEYGIGGPAGAQTAYWIAFRIDGTASSPRIWDLARVSGNPPVNTTLSFLEFPVPQVIGSSRNLTGGVDTTNNYVDIGLNVLSAVGAANAAVPDDQTAKAYDLCTFHGPADPGRQRSAGWSCTTFVPYTNSAVTGHPFKVPCPSAVQDTWVSIGVTFSGGAGPDVKSALVGRAIQVECNPTIADPEPLKRPAVRPSSNKKATTKPARSR